jgi:predicted glycogen debranching enzyme
MVMLSKLEESLLIEKHRYDLSCNQYQDIIHPEGYKYLEQFRLDPYPVFTYKVQDVVLEKSVFMVYNQNTTVITYKILSAKPGAVALLLRPLVAARDYHSVSYENNFFNKKVDVQEQTVKLKPYEAAPAIIFSHNAEKFEPTSYWYRNFEYKREFERGLESSEDLFSPGHFVYILRENETASLIASTQEHKITSVSLYRRVEASRQDKLSEPFNNYDELIRQLAKAADSFIVKREGQLSSAIAGFHWFTDWGRDTLASLPGLCLSTGRFDIARNTLEVYAKYCDRGLIPSRFPDSGEFPEYNCADSSLWYMYAVGKYLEYTNDMNFVKSKVFKTMLEIIDYYIRGTRHGIKMDRDGLITFREQDIPMTWMDTKVKDQIVVNRFGKTVEVNALWYNALKVMEKVIGEFDKELQKEYGNLSEVVRENFNKVFWNEKAGYLYDWIGGSQYNEQLRPNQIFALSLPAELVPKKRAKHILEVIKKELLTPYGLRTLSARDKAYKPRYEGDQHKRDSAYHQGTVWAYFIGPFITAYIRVHGNTKKARTEARRFLEPFNDHLREAGLGTISEIFDAERPHKPNGCISFAWSVAEIIRCYYEDIEAKKPQADKGISTRSKLAKDKSNGVSPSDTSPNDASP